MSSYSYESWTSKLNTLLVQSHSSFTKISASERREREPFFFSFSLLMFINLRTKLLPFCFYEERPQIPQHSLFSSSQPKEANKSTLQGWLLWVVSDLPSLPERKRKLHKSREKIKALFFKFFQPSSVTISCPILVSAPHSYLSSKTKTKTQFLLFFIKKFVFVSL